MAPDDLVFGAVGRLSKVKGHDLSLVAFKTLIEHFPEKSLRLVLVGEGPEGPALQDQAAQLGLSGKVLFPGKTNRPWEAHITRSGLFHSSKPQRGPVASGFCGRPWHAVSRRSPRM